VANAQAILRSLVIYDRKKLSIIRPGWKVMSIFSVINALNNKLERLSQRLTVKKFGAFLVPPFSWESIEWTY
jgi:hypothetical protein